MTAVLLRRRARVRRRQHRHGVPEGGDHRHLRDRGPEVHRYLQLASLHAAEYRHLRTLRLERRACRAPRSSSSPTSDSIRPRPRPSRRAIRSATCRSASSAHWSSPPCSMSRWPRCMTGMVPFQQLNVDAPGGGGARCAPAARRGSPGSSKSGVIAGMTSVILTSLLGQPRILLSMADDGLLPPAMSRCHPRFKTPHVATVWHRRVRGTDCRGVPPGCAGGSHFHRHPARLWSRLHRRAGVAVHATR